LTLRIDLSHGTWAWPKGNTSAALINAVDQLTLRSFGPKNALAQPIRDGMVP
jgi:hypothetical protein